MIGPGFWKINSPNFFNENIFSQTRASLTGRNLDLNLLKLDKNFLNSALSSKDLFNKEIAVAWSENMLIKAKNDFQIPRIFFSQLPDDLYTYELKNRKKLFITIMLPLLVRGNEIVSSERKKIKLLFYRQKYEQLKNYCSKYKVSIKICSINQPISMKKVNALKKSTFNMSVFGKKIQFPSAVNIGKIGFEISEIDKKLYDLQNQYNFFNFDLNPIYARAAKTN